jgi:hypothetical protein
VAFPYQTSGKIEIVVQEVSSDRAIYVGFGTFVRWAPDGRSVAFRSGTGSLEIVDLTTRATRTISAPAVAYDRFFDWSPDGEWLIARTADRLEVINVATRQRIALPWARLYVQPAWRPAVR